MNARLHSDFPPPRAVHDPLPSGMAFVLAQMEAWCGMSKTEALLAIHAEAARQALDAGVPFGVLRDGLMQMEVK